MPMNYARTALLLVMLTAIFVAMGALIGGRQGMLVAVGSSIRTIPAGLSFFRGAR